MIVKKCPSCEAQLNDLAVICPSCGARFGAVTQSSNTSSNPVRPINQPQSFTPIAATPPKTLNQQHTRQIQQTSSSTQNARPVVSNQQATRQIGQPSRSVTSEKK